MEDDENVEEEGDIPDSNSDEAIEGAVQADWEEVLLSMDELPHKSAAFENGEL